MTPVTSMVVVKPEEKKVNATDPSMQEGKWVVVDLDLNTPLIDRSGGSVVELSPRKPEVVGSNLHLDRVLP